MKRAVARLAYAILLFLIAALPAASLPAAAENPSRITVIDNASRVKLANTTHPLVASATDLGRVAASTRLERMILVVSPADEMQTALGTFIDSLHDKMSPNYHQWLTPQQFGERFGPSQADLAKIAAWLQGQGFDSIKISPGRSHIEFSGSSQLVEQAFQTQMHRYQRGSETHIANSSDISIPQALAGEVRGVNLQNFSFTKATLIGATPLRRNAGGNLAPVDPAFTPADGTVNFLAPEDYSKIYDFGPLYQNGASGLGSTIAIVARSNISLADVEQFRQIFGLPPNDPIIIVNGIDPGFDGFNGDAIEASLDTEWSGAVAPNATVDLVVSSSTTTTDGVFLSAIYIVDNDLADVMSTSFGECEANLGATQNAFINALWQQAAAEGISAFVSTGDSGAAGCDPDGFAVSPSGATGGLAVSGLASTPFNTAVGGTEFNDTANPLDFWTSSNDSVQGSVLGYIPEMVWNESCFTEFDPNCIAGDANALYLSAGGGGVSTVYSKPSWQSTSLTGVPNDHQRDLPDVALSASVHDSYLICISGFAPCTTAVSGGETVLQTAGTVGGTSASSPSFAGIMALIDQKQGGRQGLANYVLYPLAAQENFSGCNSSNRSDPSTPVPSGCIFNDITLGNNGVPGNDVSNDPTSGALGYPATVGYDLGSGLGSVNAANLVSAWNSVNFRGSATTLAANSATTIQHGQSVSFSVSVDPLSAGSGTPTGAVSLIAQNGATLSSNGTAVASGTLVNGTFSTSASSLPGGQYNVIAYYAGDGDFGSSSSNAVPVTVSQEDSSLTLTVISIFDAPVSSPISLSYGTTIFLLAAVAPASGNGVATGTVTFSDGGVPFAQAPLDSAGVAELVNCSAAVCLSQGQHSLTASYSGDSSFNPSSTSQTLEIDVGQGSPILLASIFQASFLQGAEVVFEFAEIGTIQPTGTIEMFDDFGGTTTQLLPSVVLDGSGDIPANTFPLAAGTHNLTFIYSGDSNYQGVTQGPFTITQASLSGLPTETALMITPSSVTVGQPVTFSVNVTPVQSSSSVPSGEGILFTNEETLLGPLADFFLTNGSFSVQIIIPRTGTQVFADYLGDSTFAGSLSNAVPISIAKGTATVALSSNAQTVSAKQQVTLLSSVTPPASAISPSGTVQFFDSFNGGTPAAFGSALPLSASNVLGAATNAALPAFLPLGTHVFTASYSGDFDYNPVAASGSNSVTVIVNNLNAQKVIFPALPNPVNLGVAPLTLAATATSGLPVTYTVSGPATLSGSTLTITGGGLVTVTASQLGSASFNPAAPVSQAITVNPGNEQTIDFQALASPVTFGIPPITLTATATSGLPVTFSASGPAFASGSTLTIVGAGSVVVTANQAGNATFAPAPPVLQTIMVNPEAQTINFPALPSSVSFGTAPITLQATSTSGLPVSYSLTGPASVSGSTLTITGVGSVTVTANQSGNANFTAAPPVSQTITVNPSPQSINFPALPSPVNLGVPAIALVATATSGLPVSFTATGPASVSGSTLSITGVGSVTVTANQSGNANFTAAPPVSQTITVISAANANFSLTSNTQSLTLQPGQSGTVTITVTPSGGFDSQVSFSCGQQSLVTCSFNPATLTPSGAPVSTTLTVTASSNTSSLAVPKVWRGTSLSRAFAASIAGFVIGIAMLSIRQRPRRTKRMPGAIFALFIGLLMACVTACGGGGGGSSGGGTGGNSPQSASVTVTANASGATQTLSLTITVNP